MVCKNCGYKLEAEWEFCPRCSWKIEREEVLSEPECDTMNEPPQPPKTPGVEAYYMEKAVQPQKYMPAEKGNVSNNPQTWKIRQSQYAPDSNTAAEAQTAQQNSTKIIAAVAIGSATLFTGVLLLIICFLGGSFSSGCRTEKTESEIRLIENYIKAIESDDKDRIIDFYHRKITDYHWESYGVIGNFKDHYYKEHHGQKAYGYNIEGVADMDSAGGENLKEEAYRVYGLDINDVKSYTVLVSFESYSDFVNITLVKVGKEWYVYATE